jgi:hypothetical protein
VFDGQLQNVNKSCMAAYILHENNTQ